ncbi:MAG: radical SAM protein [Clostridia bacterium]|nr:radical SAM protein [Clostridia bacterium]
MGDSSSAIQFLKELRQENGKRIWSYKSLARYLDRKAKEKGVPICGQFELTPLCNLSCKMCYVHLNADQLAGQNLMPVETWKDLMHQAWEAGMIHVTLTGGECLTYPGFDEIYLYLQSLGCDVTILTNAYLLDGRRLDFFLKHRPALIQVSLYGWNDDVYERVTGVRAFTTVTENVRKAIEAGLNVRLVITPSKYLGEDVLETIRFARSITPKVMVNSTIIAPRKETGRSAQLDDLDADYYVRIFRLMNELDGIETREIDPEKLPPAGGPFHECEQCGLECGGGRAGFVVNWKGSLMPCNSLEMIHADLLQDGFRAAWAKIHQEVNNWPRVPECKDCAYYETCYRCAGIMLQYAEPGKQPTELCERVIYLAQHGLMKIPECE